MTGSPGGVRPCRIERAPRRRGAFGLDDRRRPDPERVEAALRAFLTQQLPEVLPLSGSGASDGKGRLLALLLPHGHVAVLRIAADRADRDPAALALAAHCAARRIPHATVSSFIEGRAALRRLGIEPRPAPACPAGPNPFGKEPACRARRTRP